MAPTHPPPIGRRAVVIGGTGMLGATTRRLASTGWHTHVVARRPGRVAAAGPAHPRLRLHAADWTDAAGYTEAIDGIARAGAVDLVVLWAHGSAGDVPLQACERLAPRGLVHVRSSAAADPTRVDAAVVDAFAATCERYREVVLGFVRERERTRWLTHAEISAGVDAAIAAVTEAGAPPRARSIVGIVRPWSARP